MRRHALLSGLLASTLLYTVGCPPDRFDNTLPPLQSQVSRIQNDSTLTPQQQRQQLEDLGLTPSIINAILRSVRTGNQFGGDLRTAYEKIAGERFTELTPDEVQIYGDEATKLQASLAINLDDAPAQAIVDFFQQQQINTRAELTAYLASGNEIPGTIPAGVLPNLFVDFDPALVIPDLPA